MFGKIDVYGVSAKLPKEYFKCRMCATTKLQEVYIWGNFAILPKHPYKEYKICKKCAIREHGKRVKLEDIIDKRTKKWLKNQKQNK